MGFISNVFDVKKLTQNLDRKRAIPNKNAQPISRENATKTQLYKLNDYLIENIFMPIITEDTLPIANLDFDKISEKDIAALYKAFANTNHTLLNLCMTFQAFPAAASKRQIMI